MIAEVTTVGRGGHPSRAQRLFDWIFRNRETGAITIGQLPNLPLVVFGASLLLGGMLTLIGFDQSILQDAVAVMGKVALLWWAADELLRGVNPWRRGLGAFVIIFLLVRL